MTKVSLISPSQGLTVPATANDENADRSLVTDQNKPEEIGDNYPQLNRASFFDEMNRRKQFQYRHLFKKPALDEKIKLQLEDYEQQLNHNRGKRALVEGLVTGLHPDNYATQSNESSKDFCDDIADMIGETKESYLQVYEKVLDEYITFFKSMSDILSKLPDFISDGKDGKEGKVQLNAGELRKCLQDLKKEYSDKVLYPTAANHYASKAESEDWAEKLGLSKACVMFDAEKGYVVKFDLSPVDQMLSGLSGFKDQEEMSSAKYQAWKAGFDAQVEKVNNYVQTLSQKYTTANSTYDNLVKVLSSTITSMYDADKEFLKN